MPRKPNYKNRRSKRTVTYKARGSNRPGKISRNISQRSSMTVGVPLCWNVKLRYVQHVNVSTNVPGAAHMWRLNSVWDPDYTTVNPLIEHQPMYFDTFQNIYNEYLVTHAKVTLTFQQTNASDEPVTIFWGVKDQDTLINAEQSISAIMEQGDRTMLQLGYAGSGSATKCITQNVDIAAKHGIKGKLTPVNTAFTAPTGATLPALANPENQTLGILQVFASNSSPSNPLRVSLNYNVIIDYTTCFFNRKEAAQS